jgi:hypothetical protein
MLSLASTGSQGNWGQGNVSLGISKSLFLISQTVHTPHSYRRFPGYKQLTRKPAEELQVMGNFLFFHRNGIIVKGALFMF